MDHSILADIAVPDLSSAKLEPLSLLKCNQKVFDKLIEKADGKDIIYSEQFDALFVSGRLVFTDDSISDDRVELYTEIPKPKPMPRPGLDYLVACAYRAKPIKECVIKIPII